MSKKQTEVLTSKKAGPMVYGNGLTQLMRVCYEHGDFVAVCEFFPKWPCGDVIAVCTKKARITGDDVEGYEVEYEDA